MADDKKIYGENRRGRPLTETKKNINALGKREIKSLTKEEREKLGSKSHTLHFINLLGLGSIQTTRNQDDVVDDDDYDNDDALDKKGMKPVGVTLISDEDIEVRYMKDVTLTSVNLWGDFEEPVIIPAGEPFHLTHYEFMFLVLRDEYAGFVSYNGDDRAVHLSVRTDKFLNSIDKDGQFVQNIEKTPDGYERIKLPSPMITYAKGKGYGSMRDEAVQIDVKLKDGKWDIVSEEYKRFKALIPEGKRAMGL